MAAARRDADAWLAQPPVSVMQKGVMPPSQNKHDYMSLDKYYWPCDAPPPAAQTSAGAADDSPDPTCKTGAKDGLVCCLAMCGTCGGHGCADEPGGKPGCCISNIKAANRSCTAGPAPCIIDPADNCDQATGLPWQRRDGVTNPQIAKYDHDRLINMTTAVTDLASAHYFSEEPKYAAAAIKLLRTWFLNPATAQNPASGLNFGHFIPGVSNGSHGAVIDIHSWPEMLDGVAMLRQSPTSGWTAEDDGGLIRWFSVFLGWLVESPLGVQESQATNNHGVWYSIIHHFPLILDLCQHLLPGVGTTCRSSRSLASCATAPPTRQLSTGRQSASRARFGPTARSLPSWPAPNLGRTASSAWTPSFMWQHLRCRGRQPLALLTTPTPTPPAAWPMTYNT